MIGNNYYSKWGIKDSGEDITTDILGILQNAQSFIVVGGYNFTFKTAGFTFFNLLQNKVRQGIPTLIIIPPNLTGYHNNQTAIINFCIANNIALILNGNNHSKWIMTENDLYYGSSNFTETSWLKRIEVVTIHRHNHIYGNWKRRTLLDFRLFVQRQIATLNRRRAMRNIPGLIANTTATWNNIIPLIQRLNPSIEKVISTLNNYNEVETMLNQIIEAWFQVYNTETFNLIHDLNFKIMESISKVCEYGYLNIYNETVTEQIEFSDREIIENYNNLHDSFIKTISKSLSRIQEMKFSESTDQLFEKNLGLISNVEKQMNNDNIF
jgi:hypothetical protein